VVIADEAPRSQYDFIASFAHHLRGALPHASFIGFTGTPIELTGKNTGFNGMDRSPSQNGLIMGQNGYAITRRRGRIHDELYNTRDRFSKAGVPPPRR
jgi:SWI2/SNF2 ATPase